MAAFNHCPPSDLSASHLRLPLPPPSSSSSDFGSVIADLPSTTSSSSPIFPASDDHRLLRRHGRTSMAAPNWSALLNPAADESSAAVASSYAADFAAAAGFGSLYDGKDSGESNLLLLQKRSSSRINGTSPYPAAAELEDESAHTLHHQMQNLMDEAGSLMHYHHQNDSSLSALLISADPAAMATFSLLNNNVNHAAQHALFPPSSASTTSSSSTEAASTEHTSHGHVNTNHLLHPLRSQLQPQPAAADHPPGRAGMINIIPHSEPSISIPANTSSPHHGQIHHHHRNNNNNHNNTPLQSSVLTLTSHLHHKNSTAESSPKTPHLNHTNGTTEPSKKKRNQDSLVQQHMKDNASTHVKEVGGTEEHKSKHPKHNNNNSNNSSDEEQLKDMVKPTASAGANCGDSTQKPAKENTKPPETPKPEYIHVRARRGQATDSHSLAERIRREKISERMKYLQDLVPGCSKVTGKAVMLDEIINYVQSLQRQVEFLSMKLAAVNPRMEFNMESLFGREMGSRVPSQLQIPVSNSSYAALSHQQHVQQPLAVPPPTVSCLSDTIMAMASAGGGRHSSNPLSLSASVDSFRDSASASQQHIMQAWEDELQSLVQGRQNLLSPPSCSQGQGL